MLHIPIINGIPGPLILRAILIFVFFTVIVQFPCNADEVAIDTNGNSQKAVQSPEAVTLYNFDSTTNDPSAYYIPLYADHKGRQVGDIVTIIIYESSKASKSSSTSTSKKSGTNGSLSEFFGLTDLPMRMGAEAESGYAGSGTTARTGSMEARISVTIKEILPNGNLVLEGTRQVSVNDDIQDITLRGTARPKDIKSDNTIISTYLADAKIEYTGKGPIAQRPGILTRIIQTPFHWVASIFRMLL